jgi:4-amino-4-deoxy-L-arabinose transferase-like glycosyltransferase
MQSKHFSVLLLLVGILIFVFFRIQYHHLAFHWDEMWSYVPAVRAMHANGVSMLPSSMDPIISRGHPLFFYALNASFLNIFGTSNAALHTLPLMVSIVCIVTTYWIGRTFFSEKVGLVSAFLLMTQSLFFVQSAMVLPEVMVTALVLLSFYAFFKENIYLYWLFASLLVLTKESGIVLPAALAACYFFSEHSFKSSFFWKKIAWIVAPLGVFAAFLLLQKYTFGWFLFPEHVGMMKLTQEAFLTTLENCFNQLFLLQNRRNIFVLGAIVALFLFLLNKKYRFATPKNLHFLPYFFVFLLFYLIFSSANFYTARYVMCAIPIGFLMVTAAVFELMPPKKHFLAFLIFAFGAAATLQFTLVGKNVSDVELGAFDLIGVQHKAANAIEKYVPKDQKPITRYGFLKEFSLKTAYCGYLNEPYKEFEARFLPGGIGYYLSIESDKEYDKAKAEGKLEILHRFEKNNAFAEIYRVK